MRCFYQFSDITVLLTQMFHCYLFSQHKPSPHSEQFRNAVHRVSNDLIKFQQYKWDCYGDITKVCNDLHY
jgi:hypothetical protein